MKKVSDVFKSIRFAKMDPKHDKGPATSTDDEEHGAVSSQEFAQQLAHVKKRAMQEDLRNWFDKDHPKGGWKRINSKGEAIGPCAREPGEPKPKCMSNEKRAALSKKERASAVSAKRRHDPDAERKGKPINVSNFGKGKLSEDMEQLDEKNVPTSPEKWAQAKSQAKAKFDVYPSAYANGWAAKKYKEMGGGWKSVNEAIKDKFDIGEYDQEGDMAKSDLRSIIANAQKLHDMIEDADNLPEWCQNKITLAEDYISTVANYLTAEMKEEISESKKEKPADITHKGPAPNELYVMRQIAKEKEAKATKKTMAKEEVEQLEEGRPSQRHPLEGHEYHKKTNAELEYIAKDAHKAAEAMKSHNTTAENKYRDQANDSATVRHFRKTSGTPDWYKKKYGLKEEVEQIDELSNDMLGRYKTAAGADASKADKAGDYAKGNKRFSGIVKATKKQFDNDMKKEETTPPFDGPYRKATGTVTDKSGAKHTAHSQVKDLAKKAMQAQAAKMKPVKESLEESRKSQIIKDASKSAKEKAAKTKDKFEADPILSSEIVKEDK